MKQKWNKEEKINENEIKYKWKKEEKIKVEY